MMVPMPSNSTISKNQALRLRLADQRVVRRFTRGTRPTLDESALPSSCSVERPCCCVFPSVLRFVIISLSSRHEYMVSFPQKTFSGTFYLPPPDHPFCPLLHWTKDLSLCALCSFQEICHGTNHVHVTLGYRYYTTADSTLEICTIRLGTHHFLHG